MLNLASVSRGFLTFRIKESPAHRSEIQQAIERGILAGFEIDVLEIRAPSPGLGLSEEALRDRRLALLQTVLLEHAAARNLRTVMTFHQRVEEAAAFAEKMPQTAARLYAAEVSAEDLADAETLPKSSIDAEFYELEASRHVPRRGCGRGFHCGRLPGRHRRRTAQGPEARTGWTGLAPPDRASAPFEGRSSPQVTASRGTPILPSGQLEV